MYVYEYICIYIIPSMLGWFSQKSGRSFLNPFIKPPGSRLHTGHRDTAARVAWRLDQWTPSPHSNGKYICHVDDFRMKKLMDHSHSYKPSTMRPFTTMFPPPAAFRFTPGPERVLPVSKASQSNVSICAHGSGSPAAPRGENGRVLGI